MVTGESQWAQHVEASHKGGAEEWLRSLYVSGGKIGLQNLFLENYLLNNDQINTEPMVSQIGMLSVVEAPDILYNQVYLFSIEN